MQMLAMTRLPQGLQNCHMERLLALSKSQKKL